MRNGLCQTGFFLLSMMRILIKIIFPSFVYTHTDTHTHTHTHTLIVPKNMFIAYMQCTHNSPVVVMVVHSFSNNLVNDKTN